MQQLTTGNSGGQQTFRLGLIAGEVLVVVIATQNMSEQSRYTTQPLGNNAPDGAVIWMGTFMMPSGTATSGFAGPAQYQSVMVGRYQYVLNAGGRPVIVGLNVGPLNGGLVPPSGRLRLLTP